MGSIVVLERGVGFDRTVSFCAIWELTGLRVVRTLDICVWVFFVIA